MNMKFLNKLKIFLAKIFPETQFVTFIGCSFFISIMISIMLYPGTFSPDSFNQLNQATNHQYNTWHPIIMALVMHYLLDIFGVGGIFILHQIIYWLALALIIDCLFARRIIYLFMGFFPPLFLLTIEVWKDSGMLVFCIFAFACFLQFYKNRKCRYLIYTILAILYASCVRINALCVTTVLVGFASVLLLNKISFIKKIILFFVSVISLIGFTLTVNNAINKVYHANIGRPLPTLLLWDMAGICKFSGMKCELPKYIKVSEKNKALNWINNYESNGCTLCWTSGISCGLSSSDEERELIHDWFILVKNNPVSYLKHKMSFAKILFNFKHDVYYPYQTYDMNLQKDGDFIPTKIGLAFFDKIRTLGTYISKIYMYHSFFWFTISIVILIYLIAKSLVKRTALVLTEKLAFVLCVSGVINAISLVVVAPAADYRYMIWTVCAAFLSCFVLISKKITEN